MSEPQWKIVGNLDQILVIRLPARLFDETAGAVQRVVEQRSPRIEGFSVVLDATDVEMINSMGITCLLQMQDECRRRNGAFGLAALPAPVHAFLATLKLEGRFPLYASVEDAISAAGDR